MEGEGDGTALHYFPSIHGETEPSYNHRCDVFNRVVCIIQAHPKYKECGWIAEIIEAASAFADRMNKAQAERRTETMTKHHCQGEDGA
jgi:hypothetical protein